MTTPREELIKQYSEKFGGNAGFEVLRDMEKNIEQLLKPYAIGRWVSVDERLPVVDGSGRWAGYTKDLEGLEAFGLYDYHDLCVFYSAWLDLDLPEVEG